MLIFLDMRRLGGRWGSRAAFRVGLFCCSEQLDLQLHSVAPEAHNGCTMNQQRGLCTLLTPSYSELNPFNARQGSVLQ